MPFSDLAENYWRLGLDYYIAARYSVLVRLTPTAGNQFHHAVEMLLKGDLADTTSASERRNLGHKLSKVWRAFKDKAADSTLDQFDATVAELDKFEDIRYPENLVGKGAGILFDWTPHGSPRPAGRISRGTAAPVPEYKLYVCDIDRLVATIIDKCGFNLGFFTVGMHEDATKFLVIYNAFIAGDLPTRTSVK